MQNAVSSSGQQRLLSFIQRVKVSENDEGVSVFQKETFWGSFWWAVAPSLLQRFLLCQAILGFPELKIASFIVPELIWFFISLNLMIPFSVFQLKIASFIVPELISKDCFFHRS
ncbi:hypothetical protein MRB53_028887 [Persea americana]|uniref:Uncharacterized protein n=1 Tax=Persea americana TaxID=3435 RepID=A0ACC2KH60_PERAE|nr:hypothetical protein MRB53_028887 [Persea americana]